MAVTLLANACPAVQVPADFLSIAAVKAPPHTPNAPGAEVDLTSEFGYLTLYPHATRIDLAMRGGGANATAIISDSNAGNELKLVAPGSGLLLTIKAGHAAIGTDVEVSTDVTLPIPDGHDDITLPRVWVWLKQDGTRDYTFNTTPPSGLCCLLGSVLTSGGNITQVDTSGVLYVRGGLLHRESADAAAPADTPPTRTHLHTKTAGGSYHWNGTLHSPATTAAGAGAAMGLGTASTHPATDFDVSGAAATAQAAAIASAAASLAAVSPYIPLHGSGSPEGVVTAPVGTLYTDTTTPALFQKLTGAGNTGWGPPTPGMGILPATPTTSAVAGAATLNGPRGSVTSEALTTTMGSDYVLTLTNSSIHADSIFLWSISNGTNTTPGAMQETHQCTSGQVVITVHNSNVGLALNGTLVISFALG